jgi:hypothetical protein
MARAAPVALRGELAPGEAGQRWRAADSCLRMMWGGAALAEGDQGAVPGVARTSEQLWFSGGGEGEGRGVEAVGAEAVDEKAEVGRGEQSGRVRVGGGGKEELMEVEAGPEGGGRRRPRGGVVGRVKAADDGVVGRAKGEASTGASSSVSTTPPATWRRGGGRGALAAARAEA